MLHQRQALLKLAVVNRHLAESVQSNGTSGSIRRHIENRVESRAGFVPLASVMSINFTEVSQRRRIGRVHPMSSLVETFSSDVALSDLCTQTLSHHSFDLRTLHAIEDRRVRNAA